MEVGTFEGSHLTPGKDNESQYDNDDSENEISLQKRKRSSHSESEEDNLSSAEGDEISEYELLQRKNLKERILFLKNLDIDNPLQDLISTVNNKSKRTKPKTNTLRYQLSNLPKREPSRRIQALTARKNGIELQTEMNHSSIDNSEREPSVEVDERLSGTVKFEFNDEPLNLDDINYSYDPNLDLSNCSLTDFKGHLSCMKMIKPLKKITNKRIQSLCIHPSLTKRILLVGSASGELGVWNVDSNSKSNVAVLSYHKAPVNCISINSYDHYKVYTTSHDGTVCSVDMNNKEYSNLFSNDFSSKPRHLTWHDELDANSLLITHGCGDVGVLDLRKTEISWIKCFNRSARTVHHHPSDSNYFLVSSGTTGCKIFDLRQQKKEISEMIHPKGLTSAFFSLDGTKILTTCNDDHLRIFDATSFKNKTPDEKKIIAHNNHTGRWLSVFKANWFPFRNDTFIIGSLREPRRIEVFDCNGSIVYNLNDEEMTTISPVIAVHPKLPIIAGGNSSGKVHVFVAPEVSVT